MPLGKNRKTIAIDFDGVIHRYSKGWHDGTAYDPPMPHALEAIERLLAEHTVYVYTTRNLEEVQRWFKKHSQIPTEIIGKDEQYWTKEGVVGLANHKVICYVLVDDRALRFNGDWRRTMGELFGVLNEGK